MASASIRIDQPLNPVPNGVPGISRDDIAIGRPDIKVVAADSIDSSIVINTPAGSIMTWLNFDPSTAARYYQNVSIMNDEAGLVDHTFTLRVINDDAQSADYEIWMRIKAT